MHVFDYSFLKNEVPSSFLGLCSIIYDLKAKGEIRKNENSAVYEELRKIAII